MRFCILPLLAALFLAAPAHATITTFSTPMAAVSGGGCEPDVQTFKTDGRLEAGDGGGATWVYKPSTMIAAISCPNGRKYELSVDIANVKIFGAMGKNEGDNSDGFRQAFAYQKAKGVPVYAPAGVYQLHSTAAHIDFSGVTFYGDGAATRLRAVNMTTEVFRLDIGSNNTLSLLEFRDFSVEAYLDNPAIPALVAAFRVVGGSGYVEMNWSEFRNIQSRGFPVFFQNDAPPHPTRYGAEGAVNWTLFQNITFGSFSRESLYGWIFQIGSGTGNSFQGIGGKIHKAVWSFGSGVVGDISIEAMKHWLSANTTDSTLMFIAENTQYRSRIKMHGGQCDAGFARLIAFGNGEPYFNVDIDVMRGGSCAIGPHPALYNSRIGAAFGTVPAQ